MPVTRIITLWEPAGSNIIRTCRLQHYMERQALTLQLVRSCRLPGPSPSQHSVASTRRNWLAQLASEPLAETSAHQYNRLAEAALARAKAQPKLDHCHCDCGRICHRPSPSLWRSGPSSSCSAASLSRAAANLNAAAVPTLACQWVLLSNLNVLVQSRYDRVLQHCNSSGSILPWGYAIWNVPYPSHSEFVTLLARIWHSRGYQSYCKPRFYS